MDRTLRTESQFRVYLWDSTVFVNFYPPSSLAVLASSERKVNLEFSEAGRLVILILLLPAVLGR